MAKTIQNKKVIKIAKAGPKIEKYKAKQIGGSVAKKLNKKDAVQAKKPVFQKELKKDFFKRLKEKKGLKYSNKDFNRMYRDSLKEHDELFSTALTRDFLEGILKEKNFSLIQTEIKTINNLIDEISNVRIKTKYSGFSLKNISMQHPTSGKEGVFSKTKGTASQHSHLDKMRREYVENAMEKASKNTSYSAMDITRTGIKASIEFTLNYFTAPIEVKDIKPYSLSSKSTKAQIKEQMESREKMKKLYIKLDGKLRTKAESKQSISQRRSRLETVTINQSLMKQRDPSPFRGIGEQTREWLR